MEYLPTFVGLFCATLLIMFGDRRAQMFGIGIFLAAIAASLLRLAVDVGAILHLLEASQ